eukprot:CAMPEP_0113486466 /NCGR_PEP_ID=MMETSP0014_2-20120614/25011_1 /TAXON_ID=2857 /ORGANISM="Nitzschia sp." /LENGTH=123 /DNA_ID=CAMNT_0000380139 /DNA_START=192 /DNA_END=563 /DNA_ORIENTATION=+ /assembly_acc=CAM_ASM_000159
MAPVQNTATKSTQRRAMGGGGHAPAPEWEGIDKVVRGVFPGDHQMAMAIMGGYLGLYFIFSIKSAMTKKTPEPAVTPAAIAGDAKPGSGMPSVDSPEFADYVDSPAFHKEIESNEYWAALGEK